MNHSSRMGLLCAVSLMALAGCSSGSVKETLGISRSAPDEFRVMPRPALSVPPQFNLRPPATSGEDIAAGTMPASKQGESIVLGNGNAKGETFTRQNSDASSSAAASKPAKKGGTNAEAQFLNKAGADKADPKVRTELFQDKTAADQPIEEDTSWWDIFSTSPSKKDPTVNPTAESDRIKNNKEEGKPVTEGDTPQVKPKDRGILGRILGD